MGLFAQNVNQLNMKINQFILVSGIPLPIKDRVGGYNVGWMEADMKDTGRMIELISKGYYIMLMVISMMENG